jgi:nitroreductase
MTSPARSSETITLLRGRASVRDFGAAPVPDELVDDIVAAAVRAPTSFNFQAYSLVLVRDVAAREGIAALTKQRHIAAAPLFVVVCADVARLWHLGARYGEPTGPEHEDLALSAVIDASLAGMCLALSAESVGLGTVMIGAIRNRPGDIAALLDLPVGVTALFGVCLGWPASTPGTRPRLRAELVAHDERYQPEQSTKCLAADESTLLRPDGPVTADDVAGWEVQHIRGLRLARQRRSAPVNLPTVLPNSVAAAS